MMIKRISNIIGFWLINQGVICENKQAEYEYIIEVLAWLVSPFLIMTVISIFTREWIGGYILLLPFSTLRRNCKGFHFTSQYVCLFTSTVLMIGLVLFGRVIHNSIILICASLASSAIILFSLQIIYSGTIIKRKKNQKVICMLVAWHMVIGALLLLNKTEIAKWIELSLMLTGALQMPLLTHKSDRLI